MKITSLSTLPEQAVSHNPDIKKKVMLHRGELPHLTNFSQAHFAPGQVSPAHSHADMCEVFFVEAGEGVIYVDGVPYPLQSGTCIAVDVNEAHEICNTGSIVLVLTYFGLRVEPNK